MLRIHIMARSAIPCVGALRPHAIHRAYAMGCQTQNSRRYGQQREWEEEQAAVEDGEEMWPRESHFAVPRYHVPQQD